MYLKADKNGCFEVCFLLLPEYAMVALISAIEPMRVANRLANQEIFRWQLVTIDGNPVAASNQLVLGPHLSIHDIPSPQNIFVCSSFHPERYLYKEAISWLQRASRQGALIGAVDTGCYLLQAAGMLKKHRVTLHWEAVPAFQEDFPDVDISNELFEIGPNLITCAGGSSAIDMMLHIIQVQLGNELAIKVCEQFIKGGIRQKTDNQRVDLAARLNIHHPRLLRVVEIMEANLDTPWSPFELAAHAHLSVRQLERLFRTHLDDSPSGYYQKLRLQRARQLLRESRLRVGEIVTACGFSSNPHFTRCYRKYFGCSPKQDRRPAIAEERPRSNVLHHQEQDRHL